MPEPRYQDIDMEKLVQRIRDWSAELGFQQLGITDIDLSTAEQRLRHWLERGFHGTMHYMEKHGSKRSHPEQLVPGTIRVISVRMDYLPQDQPSMLALLQQQDKAYVSRYALGRDYHKLIRNRLQKLADRIAGEVGEFGYRAFTDSAPVLEKALAEKAGLGWIGKHSNLINRDRGSWFFLGEIYTDLPLPIDQSAEPHCGTCSACIDCCPTNAIVEPFSVDARKCISYLTIELEGSIPVELRSGIGNRIYGCDDCQLYCPWNRFASLTSEGDFRPRHNLDSSDLVRLFNWTEEEFLQNTEGSAIRRIGHERWLRNIAVALGNGPVSAEAMDALTQRRLHESPLVREHVEWALAQFGQAGKD